MKEAGSLIKDNTLRERYCDVCKKNNVKLIGGFGVIDSDCKHTLRDSKYNYIVFVCSEECFSNWE